MLLLCPLQRRMCIGQFLCQSKDKVRIAYSLLRAKVRNDGLCQAGVIGGMPTLALLLLSCCMQPLEGIVPYNFQYGEAHDAMCQNIRLYEAGIDQGGKREDGFFHLALGQTDRLSCLQRPASHEDAKGTETTL